ncbi:hypothetical protein CcaverHIS631_0211000 [Cutaneotrichosporon cavernicola]|nr:hypothetical protein CcaverHIS631_0211000 [Cutaneotrichosporon cavernicola]
MILSLRARSVITRLGPVSCRSSYLRRYLSTDSERPAEPFRVLFCGSDAFSVAALDALLGAEDVWQSLVVLTPRERAIGRSGKDTYIPPLKLFALERDIEHHDVPPGKLSFPEAFQKHHPSHLLLTASFGHIIPTPLLSPFAHALNVHPSVLPLYRGAAPVQWAIANGDSATGVTVQSMAPREVGVDAGAVLGAVEGLNGAATPHAQDSANVTRAPKITNDTARVNWGSQGAGTLDARHRAFGHTQPLWAHRPQELVHGNPKVKRDQAVQLTSVKRSGAVPEQAEKWASEAGRQPGTIVLDKRGRRVLALTRDGWLELVRVRPAGKKEQPGAEWWNGLPPNVKTRGWGILE